MTDITFSGDSVAEERRQLRNRPGRLQSVLLSGLAQNLSARLQMILFRMAHEERVFPLYSDVSIVQSAAGLTIFCDTQYRRFFFGQRIAIASWSGSRLVNLQYRIVTEIFADRLTVDALSPVPSAGARVYPVIDVHPNLSIDQTVFDREKISASVTVLERIGNSTLPATRTGLPEVNNFYLDLPVLEFRFDWSSSLRARVTRAGDKFGEGRDEIVTLAGARPQMGFRFDYLFTNRADFWEVLKFFDSRRGRRKPFWVVNPLTLFKPTGVTSFTITVEALENIEDLDAFLEYLGVEASDGRTFILPYASAVDNLDGTWTITFTEDLSVIGDPGLIKRVTSAHLCRFAEDAIREEWMTGDKCRVTLNIVELLSENPALIVGAFPDPQSFAIQSIPNFYRWFDASHGIDEVPVLSGSNPVDTWVDRYDEDLSAVYGTGPQPDYIFQLSQAKSLDVNKRLALLFTGTAGATDEPLRLVPDEEFFDNTDGLTMFAVVRGGVHANELIFARAGCMVWSFGSVIIYDDFGVGGSIQTANIGGTPIDKADENIWVTRWTPGDVVKAYKNGGTVASSPGVINDMDFGSAVNTFFFRLGDNCMGLSLLIYKRALSVAETNQVGRLLASMYRNILWQDITV